MYVYIYRYTYTLVNQDTRGRKFVEKPRKCTGKGQSSNGRSVLRLITRESREGESWTSMSQGEKMKLAKMNGNKVTKWY